VLIDHTTRTGYVLSEFNSLAVIDLARCNGADQSGCPTRPNTPRLATGLNSIIAALNPQTHTVYSPSQDTNTVWTLDISTCNAHRKSELHDVRAHNGNRSRRDCFSPECAKTHALRLEAGRGDGLDCGHSSM
jgi:hypothetical protein